jgi:hypothetical protein
LGRGRGITGLSVSMATSIMLSIIARAIMDRCLRAESVLLRIARHSAVKRCMTPEATRLPEIVNRK